MVWRKLVAIPGVSEERPSVEERQRREHYLVMVEILGVARLNIIVDASGAPFSTRSFTRRSTASQPYQNYIETSYRSFPSVFAMRALGVK